MTAPFDTDTADGCPGLFHAVRARDGWLVRLRLPGGVLQAAQLRALADFVDGHGDGGLELTNRANLQIRGLRAGGVETIGRLAGDIGLAPDDPAADGIRNILLSPAAGLDPSEMVDPRPVAALVERVLMVDRRCHLLSPKLSVLVDGGGDIAEADRLHDIIIACRGADTVEIGFATTLNELDGLFMAPGDVPAVIAAAADLLLATFPDNRSHRRLGRLITAHGRPVVLAILGAAAMPRAPVPARARRSIDWVGLHPQHDRGRVFAGVGVPFGRLAAVQARLLAELVPELRVSPWRGVVLPGLARQDATAVLDRARAAGLIVVPKDARLDIVACIGAPGCAKTLAETRDDAHALAARLLRVPGKRRAIHLSGCARACAWPHFKPGPDDVLLTGSAEHPGYAVAIGGRDLGRMPAAAALERVLAVEETIDA